jgi:hypothetical protein
MWKLSFVRVDDDKVVVSWRAVISFGIVLTLIFFVVTSIMYYVVFKSDLVPRDNVVWLCCMFVFYLVSLPSVIRTCVAVQAREAHAALIPRKAVKDEN